MKCCVCVFIYFTCQPVTEKVLPAEETVRVRSHIRGREAKWTWPCLFGFVFVVFDGEGCWYG